MINTLYLPELREMLAENNSSGLRDFCEAIHAARAAEFMAGLSNEEAWQVLQQTDIEQQVDIFSYFGKAKQSGILETVDVNQAAEFVAEMAPDLSLIHI